MKIKIVDSGFSHTMFGNYSLSRPNKYFQWDRNFNNIEKNELLFFTDNSIKSAVNYPNCRKIAWLIEPMNKQLDNYQFVFENQHLFEKILTYEKFYLDQGNKYTYYTAAGCWISEQDCKVWPKNKTVSTIMSCKKHVEHQQFRHFLKDNGYLKNVHCYGNGGDIPIPSDYDKIIACKDYMFQIVVDQSLQEYGFTEKIIDCFATGCVPIYRGVQDIKRYFNKKGIIYFNTPEELKQILSNINKDFYEKMMQYVLENFEKSKDFYVPEDLLYTNFISKL